MKLVTKSDWEIVTIFCSEDGYKKEKHQTGVHSELNEFLNKPIHGLWTSPKNSRISWKNFLEEELGHKPASVQELRLKKGSKIFVLNNEEDLFQLPMRYNSILGKKVVDWDKLRELGYDAFWLTEKGVMKFHHFAPKDYLDFNPWDVETIYIFDSDSVIG